MGAPVSAGPRFPVLPAANVLADDGGRAYEVLWEGHHHQVLGIGMPSGDFRFVEDQDEKRERLVKFYCRNIHNK